MTIVREREAHGVDPIARFVIERGPQLQQGLLTLP